MLDKERLIQELKQLHKELVSIYSDLFENKYKTHPNFKTLIEAEYKKEKLFDKEEKDSWNKQYVHRSAYTLLNKVLFIRICEDKGFMLEEKDKVMGEELNPNVGQKLSMIGFQKWTNLISNYSLSELIKLAFKDMNKSYSNLSLYKEDMYDWLIPNREEIDQQFLSEETSEGNPITKFEHVLKSVIETLDTSRYNFGESSDNVLGDVYENFMDRDTRKSLGQFYTPDNVIEIILENTLEKIDVVENPFVKLLDPACGSGHFLIMAYDLLREKFEENLNKLQMKYKDNYYQINYQNEVLSLSGEEYWTKKYLHYHILKNCIYGADIDVFAIQLTTINLLLKDLENATDELNIISCNSLIKWEKEYDWLKYKEKYQGTELLTYSETEDNFLDYNQVNEIVKNGEFWSNEFDFIVGNPPYVGQKGNKDLFEFFKSNKYWKDFYERKQDLYYYFIARGLEKLKKQGKLGFINPPYWLTAFATTNLKSEIKKRAKLLKVYDFKEQMVFDDASINGNIFIFERNENDENTPIEIYEYNNITQSFDYYVSRFANNDLKLGMWNIFDSNENEDFFDRVKSTRLGDIANISPGVQTGADRVSASHIKKLNLSNMKVSEGIYVLTKEELEKKNFTSEELDFVKPFYKNSQIEKYCFDNNTEEYIIVTNKIDNIDDYPNIKEHLIKYKPILDARYRNFALINADKEGKWYYLYGYRPNTNFEGRKIITPYRSKSNKFSISTSPLYGSIDIFYIDIIEKGIPIDYVLGILNSDLILYWLQKNCKKKGENLELYAEPLSNIPIPNDEQLKHKEEITKKTVQLVLLKNDLINKVKSRLPKIILEKDIYESYKLLINEIEQDKEDIYKLNNEINNLVFDLFNITKNEQRQILEYLESIDLKNTFENELIILDEKFLIEAISLFLKRKIEFYLANAKRPTSVSQITEYLRKELDNFLEIMDTLKGDNRTKSFKQLVSQILKDSSDSINQFVKKRSSLKPTKHFIRYDNEVFGLSDWIDETHKIYLIDVINYFTSNSEEKYEGTVFEGVTKTKKKAETALKNLQQLEFEDKEDYLEILTAKVKKAFD